jgi:hypothetical protein
VIFISPPPSRLQCEGTPPMATSHLGQVRIPGPGLESCGQPSPVLTNTHLPLLVLSSKEHISVPWWKHFMVETQQACSKNTCPFQHLPPQHTHPWGRLDQDCPSSHLTSSSVAAMWVMALRGELTRPNCFSWPSLGFFRWTWNPVGCEWNPKTKVLKAWCRSSLKDQTTANPLLGLRVPGASKELPLPSPCVLWEGAAAPGRRASHCFPVEVAELGPLLIPGVGPHQQPQKARQAFALGTSGVVIG